MYTTGLILYLILNLNPSFGFEPSCSRFHYEEKTLEKMIRQEVAVEKMKAEMQDMKHQVTVALADLKNERNTIDLDLKKKANDIEAMKDGMDKAVADIKARNDENIEAYSAEIENIKADAAIPLIAFRAHKAADKSITNDKVIIFTENLLNIGDAYNNQTGIFVAPVRGIYLFTAQICINTDDWAYFGIFLEARLISGTLHGDGDWNFCSSFDAISVVQQGEQVSVKCASSCDSSESMWESGKYAMNSFSGVLLNIISQ